MSASFLYLEVNVLCIALVALLFFRMLLSYDNRSSHYYFKPAVLSMLALFVCDSLWALIAILGKQQSWLALSWVINSLYFVAGAAAGVCCTFYLEAEQHTLWVGKRRSRCAFYALFVLLAALAVTAYWNHGLFYLDAQGGYHRGPLFVVHTLGSFLPVVIAAVRAFVRAHSAPTPMDRKRLRAVGLFVLPPILTELLQILIPGSTLLCAGFTFSAVMVYIEINSHLVRVDALTSLSNRFEAERLILEKMKTFARSPEHSFSLAMLDIDNFKKINDSHGHLVGDEALISVARVLRDVSLAYGAFPARYGGDEFLLLCDGAAPDQLETICGAVNQRLAECSRALPYSLAVSFGIANYQGAGQSLSKLVDEADKKLYQAKSCKRISA